MSAKNIIKKLMDKLISGTLEQHELKQLQDLTGDDPAYKDLIKMHNKLSSIDHSSLTASESEFKKMRENVLRQIRVQELNPVDNKFDLLLGKIWSLFIRPEMAVAALTLIIGFFLGRISPGASGQFSSMILNQISLFASENTDFIDTKNSPYQYSNISLKEIDQEKIELSFDVSTHLQLVREKDDPLVREVIAQSLLNPDNVGTELRAITYSETILDKKLKDALIFSMHNAPVLAARLKAMSTLIKYQTDSDIQNAFIKVLKEESSVKMRLMALDYFEQNAVEKEKLAQVLESAELKKSPAVWIKAKKYLESN